MNRSPPHASSALPAGVDRAGPERPVPHRRPPLPRARPLATGSASDDANQSVAAIIDHDVEPADRSRYEAWLRDVAGVARRSDGHVSTRVLKPKADERRYRILLQFDSDDGLRRWLGSAERREWLARAEPLIASPEKISYSAGLEDLVLPAAAGRPPKWKVALLTWLGVFACNVVLHFSFGAWAATLPWVPQHLLTSFFVVAALAWVIMPVLMRIGRRWLH